ncbi:hypothetical protein IAQ61_004258 [Plenodomus lingam]|uniref:uncharacterized protein n=1 Tax=Leptosphaeria maculans TaxID=5022 RepID=UPI00332479B7|nr:hypothetical protein IAQ61_004258 [Plenodomus lingam]
MFSRSTYGYSTWHGSSLLYQSTTPTVPAGTWQHKGRNRVNALGSRYARVSYVRVNWNEWAQHEDEDEDEDAMRGH